LQSLALEVAQLREVNEAMRKQVKWYSFEVMLHHNSIASAQCGQLLQLHKACAAGRSMCYVSSPLFFVQLCVTSQDVVEVVSDVRLLHEDVSIGMGGLTKYVSAAMVQVSNGL
jgi:hypothetical protein